ncbi:hypothetical protein CEP51_016181, partial [Fusarium floridanum]
MIVHGFTRGIVGRHGWEMPISESIACRRLVYSIAILYNPVRCLAKMALLLVYQRIAPQKWFQVTIWIAGFIVIGSTIAMSVASVFLCIPISMAWNITGTAGRCIDRNAVYMTTAALGAATDLMILCLPMPVVMQLQMPLKQKIGLIGFFCLGGITSFTSIMRVLELYKIINVQDQPWVAMGIVIWTITKSNLACVCASFTTLKAVLHHWFSRPSTKSVRRNNSLGFSDLYAAAGALSGPRRDRYQECDSDGALPLRTVAYIDSEENAHGRDWD